MDSMGISGLCNGVSYASFKVTTFNTTVHIFCASFSLRRDRTETHTHTRELDELISALANVSTQSHQRDARRTKGMLIVWVKRKTIIHPHTNKKAIWPVNHFTYSFWIKREFVISMKSIYVWPSHQIELIQLSSLIRRSVVGHSSRVFVFTRPLNPQVTERTAQTQSITIKRFYYLCCTPHTTLDWWNQTLWIIWTIFLNMLLPWIFFDLVRFNFALYRTFLSPCDACTRSLRH